MFTATLEHMKRFYWLLGLLWLPCTGFAQRTLNYSKWHQIFEDDFDNAAVTSAKWDFGHYSTGPKQRRTNSPYECYDVAPLERNKALQITTVNNTSVLRITATRICPPDSNCQVGTPAGEFACEVVSDVFEAKRYISGMLRLKYPLVADGSTDIEHRFPVHQGLFEIRCRQPKYPEGLANGSTYGGARSALWLSSYDMELDVFEANDGQGFSSTLHNRQVLEQVDGIARHPWWQNGYHYVPPYPGAPMLDDEFHTYSVLWNDDQVTWFFDGRKLFTLKGKRGGMPITPDVTPQTYFGRASELVVTLEVPIDNFTLTHWDIDYVRIYKPNARKFRILHRRPKRGHLQKLPATGLNKLAEG
jgi:hypothetical protein